MPREYTEEEKSIILRDWDTLSPEHKAKAQARGIAPPDARQPTPPPVPTPTPVVTRGTPSPLATQVPEAFRTLPPTPQLPGMPGTPEKSRALQAQDLVKMAAAMGITLGGTTGGAALGGFLGPVAPVTIPAGAALGSFGARTLNTYLGLEEPGTLGDVLSVAAPLVPYAGSAVKTLGKVPGGPIARAGKALRAAEHTTAEDLTAAEAKHAAVVARQREASILAHNKYAAVETSRWKQYADRTYAAKQEADAATVAVQKAYETKQMDAYTTALEKAKDAQAAYRQARQEYLGAVEAQKRGATTARHLPGTFLPAAPSRQLYEQFVREVGDVPVRMTAAQEAAAIVQDQLGAPLPSMQPSRLQQIATDIQELGEQGTVNQVHQYLKDIGPLTRHADSRVRRVAKQLYGGLQEALATAPGATNLLRQANAAARREFAVEDLERFIRRAIRVGNDGQVRLDAGALVTRLERTIAEDPLFAGSFSAQALQRLRSNVEALTGLPQIPARAPRMPGGVEVTDVGPPPGPVAPKTIPLPQPRVTAQTALELRPPVPPFTPPAPTAPTLPPFMSGRRAFLDMVAMAGGHATGHQEIALGLAGADALSYGLARMLLRPNMQPLLRRLMQPGGRVDARAMALWNAAVQHPEVYHLLADERTEEGAP